MKMRIEWGYCLKLNLNHFVYFPSLFLMTYIYGYKFFKLIKKLKLNYLEKWWLNNYLDLKLYMHRIITTTSLTSRGRAPFCILFHLNYNSLSLLLSSIIWQYRSRPSLSIQICCDIGLIVGNGLKWNKFKRNKFVK